MNKENSYKVPLWEFDLYMYDHLIPIQEITDYKGDPISEILPYWRRKGLTPFLPKGQWIYNISFAELIWLRMLDTLRRFSVSLPLMQGLANYLFQDAYDNNLPKKNLLHNKERLEQKKLAGSLLPEDARLLSIVEKSLEDDNFLHAMKYDQNYLTLLIDNTIKSYNDCAIILFEDGNVAEQKGTEYYTHSNEVIDITKPHIKMSITHYLSEFFDESEISNISISFILDDYERQILKEMKDKNVNEISIKMRDGKPITIKSTRMGEFTKEEAKEIRKVLGLKNYESIQISTRDERTLNYQKTTRK